MKRWIALLLSVALLLTGCGIRMPERPIPQETKASVKNKDAKKQVLMIYMVGSDLESKAGLASLDIEEILNSDIRFDNMTVYLYAGGSSYWWNDDITAKRTEVFQVTAEGLRPVYTPKNQNMAKPETLTEFIDYSYRAQEAQYYSLILWNHGGGAVLGFGADENYMYDALSLREMDKAFENTALIRDGKKLEWVGFDACLMGMIEVADMLSDYAGYMIASEEVESGAGWDYTCLYSISREAKPTGQVCGQAIIDAYRQYHETKVGAAPEYTLSTLDLSLVDTVVARLEALVEAAGEALLQGDYSRIARSRDQSKTFGKVSSNSIYDRVDLYDLSEKLRGQYPREVSTLQYDLKQMVVCHASNIRGSHGVAVYFPYENKENAADWLEVYEQTDFSPAYLKFIKTFTRTLSGERLAKWNVTENAPVENEDQPGLYQILLTPEEMENYGHATFSVWEEDAPGSYICWLVSRDVTLRENGQLSSQFQGERFFVGDSSGASLPCHATEIERREDYAKYAIPVFIIPAGNGSLLDSTLTYIHVRVDADHPEGQILGYYQNLQSDGSLFPDRNLTEISEGDIVIPFLFARQIVTREDGSLAPFDQWQSTSGTGADFKVQGDFTVTIREPEADAAYRYLFAITDTQGNQYFTDTTSVTE